MPTAPCTPGACTKPLRFVGAAGVWGLGLLRRAAPTATAAACWSARVAQRRHGGSTIGNRNTPGGKKNHINWAHVTDTALERVKSRNNIKENPGFSHVPVDYYNSVLP